MNKLLIILLSSVLLVQANSKTGQAVQYASQSSLGKSTSTAYTTASSCYCYDSDTIGKQALTLTNNFRKKNGKPALVWSQHISNLAKIHSQNMGTGQVPFGHSGFSCRVSCFIRTAKSAGENVFETSNATAANIAQQAVNAWIASPSHRANLLGNFNSCGIAVFRTDAGVWYATQTFALF
ncbi:MAG: CAP domain-containing protein [Candidatus Babeliales bacterium]|nr:CAP domain-containing protein [Candidatus Babeliales bacterium]